MDGANVRALSGATLPRRGNVW